jgi:hypothetical protein
MPAPVVTATKSRMVAAIHRTLLGADERFDLSRPYLEFLRSKLSELSA